MSIGQRLLHTASRVNPVTVGMICLGGLYVVAAQYLPPPRFDPLGAAPFPTGLGWLMIVLGFLDLLRNRAVAGASDDPPQLPKLGASAALVLALTVAYALALAVFDVLFEIATLVYLIAAALVFGRAPPRRMAFLLVLFAAFAVALGYLLKEVVYVDLP
jgi:hypothetical protein